MKMISPSNNRTGLTLVEVVVATILVATVLLVSITASANLLRNSHEHSTAIQGAELARIVLDEVSTKHFRDPDANALFGLEANESSTNRTAFDDVDDYHNYQDSTPHYRDGTAITEYSGWSFTVTVERAETSGASIALTTDDDSLLRLVTVTCNSPSSATWSQTMLVSNVPSSMPPTTSHEKYRQVTLTFAEGRNVTVVAPLHNQPEVSGI